ncbi:MAG: TA system VapC family ribonuclease toxin [Bryobacteraceae bacterium]|jgi:toxin-antitoxin system PIN domain toxin
MSYSLDVNVLLYASDRSSDRYHAANRFLAHCATGPEILCLPWPILMSYIRIATHPRIFDSPLAPDEALANVTALLALPHVRTVAEQDGFLDAYQRVSADQVIRGNLVPDAQLAAILFQHGVRTLYTGDRDFRKFDFFEVRDPFLP